jgi:hypothetical protein
MPSKYLLVLTRQFREIDKQNSQQIATWDLYYDAGFEGGFNRALGISDKEALEIHEKATEMKIDDISVAAFDKQKPDVD